MTARDAEDAVRRLNGNGHSEPAAADDGPVYTCVQGTNADLIATVARLYLNEGDEGDRVADITYGQGAFWQKFSVPDHLFFKSDRITCPGSPHDFRRLKPFCAFRPNVNPAIAWERVIFKLGRQRTRRQLAIRDWHSANMTMERGVVGAKPESFCVWIFEMLNLQPGDQFFDLFEGSGAVTRACRRWLASQVEPKPD